MQRSYAIIGTGALGGYYGCRLAHAGCDVHFLLHSDFDHVRQHGLICESKDGDFSLSKVQCYRDVRDMPQCDVVAVCLKTTQNHLLPALLPAPLKDTGVVLMMQNGLGNEAEAAQIVGDNRVIGGLCFLCANKIGPGHIQHLDYGYIRFGEYHDGVTNRLRAIAGDFERAGIESHLSDDLQTARWQKLVWNIPYNGLSVVHHTTTDVIMTTPVLRDLAEALMREVVADAAACGCQIPAGHVEKMLADTARMKPYKTSMMIDYEAGRPLEVEYIFGNPLRAAQAAGAKSPLLENLYRKLKEIDAVNRRSATA